MVGTVGDVIFAAVAATVVAAFAAIIGFFGTATVCAILPGESSQSALILSPVMAVLAAIIVFAVTFTKVYRYGTD